LAYRVRKPAATVVPDTNYVTDPHLKMHADAPDEYWHFRLVVFVEVQHQDDFRFRLSNVKSTAWLTYWVWDGTTLVARGQEDSSVEQSVTITADLSAINDVLVIEGTCISNAAGDIAIEWRKNTDGDSEPDIQVYANSFLVASRIADAV
jgi:hypothetical protein